MTPSARVTQNACLMYASASETGVRNVTPIRVLNESIQLNIYLCESQHPGIICAQMHKNEASRTLTEFARSAELLEGSTMSRKHVRTARISA